MPPWLDQTGGIVKVRSLRVNCPSGGYQWTGQPSLLVFLVLNWQPGSHRLAVSQEKSMAQDTLNPFSQIWLYVLWVWLDLNPPSQACVFVHVCVLRWVVESWQQARGRIQGDEAFLIKRKYLCLHTIVVETWDNSENSSCLMAHSLKWFGAFQSFFAYMHF